MFRKLLNVGKSQSVDKLQQQQQQLQQQKELFQLNEIRSYGFSNVSCLGYSPSLSLLAVGSKSGLLRVLGSASVEFSYQLEAGNVIRQIEFIDCREGLKNQNSKSNENDHSQSNLAARIVILSDNGQLDLFELKNFKQQNLAEAECCQTQQPQINGTTDDAAKKNVVTEYARLVHAGIIDYFKIKPDDEDRSLRVTTLEISTDGQSVYVGTEGGNLYVVPLDKFLTLQEAKKLELDQQEQPQQGQGVVVESSSNKTSPTKSKSSEVDEDDTANKTKVDDIDAETTAVNLSDEPQIEEASKSSQSDRVSEPFDLIKLDENVAPQLGDEIKSKKQGAIESIKRHPASKEKILVSYHRGLNVIYNVQAKLVEKYFYHNQVLECSCFADQSGDFFYTSHNDGSYIKWDARQGSRTKADDDLIGQLYGPYPCKPTPKIQACTGLVNDQLESLLIFSGGMPRATYDDKNPVTIVRTEPDGKDIIKTVLDFTSKVLDFVVITRPRGEISAGKSGGGAGPKQGGKKNKQKREQQREQQRNNSQIAVALAILAEEEFVMIDLLNSESYLEFSLPYLNCVHSSAITCNQHYSDISEELHKQLSEFNKQQLKGKISSNEWPITGGKVVNEPESKSHDILLTGHEDGSVNFWDVSGLTMRHLYHLTTAKLFSTNDDELGGLTQQDDHNNNHEAIVNGNEGADNQQQDESQASSWPPLKRVGRFDPYSDDARLALRKMSLCPQTGTLVVAGTGGQVLVFELNNVTCDLAQLEADEVVVVSDQRFKWKGHEKLRARVCTQHFEPGYQPKSYLQLSPPVAATSLDLRSDWSLYALGTSYGFVLYDYANKDAVINRCTLNVHDFAIVSGDATGTMSRKKSFRKSLRESFRRLRRGRSQRNQTTAHQAMTQQVQKSVQTNSEQFAAAKQAFGGGRLTTGVRTLGAPIGGGVGVSGSSNAVTGSTSEMPVAATMHRNIFPSERQVEPKVELSSIVRCIKLTPAIITNQMVFKPSLWVGTNSGQVLVYAITLASEQQQSKESSAATSGSDQSQEASSASEPQESATAVKTSARLAKEIQLRHRAPIIAIFLAPEAPPAAGEHQGEVGILQDPSNSNTASSTADSSAKSSPEKQVSELLNSSSSNASDAKQDDQSKDQQRTRPSSPPKQPGVEAPSPQISVQPRVLICSEEQFKVFNLPNLKPFCKFKLTANEGLRAKKITITQPYLICMSNQGDCAIYSVPDLKRQAQIQVCKREDVNGITSTMLTNYGEGFYLKSSSNFLRFSLSTERVLRVLSVV